MDLVVIAVFLVVLDVFVVWVLLRGAPYIPTAPNAVQRMVALCDVQTGDVALDIGSGDGRIVMAFARAGIRAHGVEINPLLVWWSRTQIRNAGLAHLATIQTGDFWSMDFSPYTIVTLFGAPHLMNRLETKLRRELSAGSRVLSLHFVFPRWNVSREDKDLRLFAVTSLL
jgi:hypothetical protein